MFRCNMLICRTLIFFTFISCCSCTKKANDEEVTIEEFGEKVKLNDSVLAYMPQGKYSLGKEGRLSKVDVFLYHDVNNNGTWQMFGGPFPCVVTESTWRYSKGVIPNCALGRRYRSEVKLYYTNTRKTKEFLIATATREFTY